MHLSMADLIAEHPFARGMSRELIEKMADFAMEVEFAPDEMIFREGEPANRFFVIREGRIVLESFVLGRGIVELQTLGAGDVLGWSWLFPPYQWHLDARAIEPVKAILFYAAPLRERCEEDHNLGHELLKHVSAVVVSRLQAARRKLFECQHSTRSAI